VLFDVKIVRFELTMSRTTALFWLVLGRGRPTTPSLQKPHYLLLADAERPSSIHKLYCQKSTCTVWQLNSKLYCSKVVFRPSSEGLGVYSGGVFTGRCPGYLLVRVPAAVGGSNVSFHPIVQKECQECKAENRPDVKMVCWRRWWFITPPVRQTRHQ